MSNFSVFMVGKNHPDRSQNDWHIYSLSCLFSACLLVFFQALQDSLKLTVQPSKTWTSLHNFENEKAVDINLCNSQISKNRLEQTAKILIRLHKCAVRSWSLLFSHARRPVSPHNDTSYMVSPFCLRL